MLLFQFIRLLLRAIDIYMILISAYVVCTWFPQARNMTLARWLQAVCEPSNGDVWFFSYVWIIIFTIFKTWYYSNR